MNNYETQEQCQGAAITGACCYRQYSLKVEDVFSNGQREEFGCKVMGHNCCWNVFCVCYFLQVSNLFIFWKHVVWRETEVNFLKPRIDCDDAVCLFELLL